ncbi:hypothetical protein U9M48_030878 [Paspalum notatum var. saurae]|uniref:C2H2-type domain-containing protein n=1 Tax=Paspalum notatum var. saurae TaxID=547442 RepID=A0AAQ3X2R2_PASNO
MGVGGGVQEEELACAPPAAAMMVPPVLVKGKRSKRQRVHAPPAEWSSSAASATAPAPAPAGTEDSGTSPARSSADDAASTGGGGGGCLTEEDEDMALCLMLLAHGQPAKDAAAAAVVVKEARVRSRRPAADGAAAAAGEYVYECKTCNRCFPSFQALGGHRTSHKKPRLLPPPTPEKELPLVPAAAEPPPAASPSLPLVPPATPPTAQGQESGGADGTVVPATAIPAPAPVAPKQELQDAPAAAPGVATSSGGSSTKHPRVHECSICGAEFGSGQALGGHMRRHRPLVPAAARDDAMPVPRKEKSLLELDLNMPAPCDEGEPAAPAITSPRFAFAAVAERPPAPLLFQPPAAASALVDCHY